MQMISLGRQQGQWLHIRLASGEDFYIEAEKCRNGYVRLHMECADSFTVVRWDQNKNDDAGWDKTVHSVEK